MTISLFSGPQTGKPCVFPFNFLGVTYYGCARYSDTQIFWCSTEVDDNGLFIRSYYGACGHDCPLHPDALKTDNTFKVTHHYDQKELVIVLKLYGILSSSILLLGLMVSELGIQ